MTVRPTPLEYLYGLDLHGIKLGLANITGILDRSENPQLKYPTVHVGGTNGKGSVVAFLDAMFRSAGYRTGRFTSPHLCDLRERFIVDGELIEAAALDGHIEYCRRLAEDMSNSPTFFEVNTAIAFRHFAEMAVDVALVEVGLGGRFDSTNVMAPELTVITNIDLEHTEYLGATLEKIAFEKAGIVKAGTPLILGERDDPAQKVILERADALEAPRAVLGRDFTYEYGGTHGRPKFTYTESEEVLGPLELSLPGAYQAENAAVAVAAARRLGQRFPKLTTQAISEGLGKALWPCRLERVLDDPPVIVDVAHNAAGARQLARSIDGNAVVVLAVSSDKNVEAILDVLAPVTAEFILTTYEGRRALSVDAICARAARHPHRRAENLREAIALGLNSASASRPIVIAGSIFAAGEARTILIRDYGAAPLRF